MKRFATGIALLFALCGTARSTLAQATQAAQTQDTAKKDTFKKSWGACLEGRGYNVK